MDIDTKAKLLFKFSSLQPTETWIAAVHPGNDKLGRCDLDGGEIPWTMEGGKSEKRKSFNWLCGGIQ